MGALPETSLDGYEALKRRAEGLLSRLQEVSSVDFKKAITWDEIKHDIVKDILAMSNLRDGGIIIIGVEERNGKWNSTGLSEEQLGTYNPDDMLDHINKYASPAITFDVVKHTNNEGLCYLVLQMHEFDEKPMVVDRFKRCMDLVGEITENRLRLSKFSSAHLFYSLYCAIYDLLYGLPESATEQAGFDSQTIVRTRTTLCDIDALFEAEYESLRGHDLLFVEASTRRTTDLSARQARHKYLVGRITRDIKRRST